MARHHPHYNSCQTREIPLIFVLLLQAASFCCSALTVLFLTCILACSEYRYKNFEFKCQNVLVVVHSWIFGGRGIFTTSRKLNCCKRIKPKFLTRSHFPFPYDDIPGNSEAYEFLMTSCERRHLRTREQFLNCKQSNCAYRGRESPLLFFLFLVTGLNLLLQFSGRFGFVLSFVLTYAVLSLRGHYECKRLNAFTGKHPWTFGGRGYLLVKN